MAGNWLMISDLDGTFLNSSGQISPYSRSALTRMIQDGAMITFASARTCATIGPMLNGLALPIPVIIMNGSACYDFQTQQFLNCKQIAYLKTLPSGKPAVWERSCLFFRTGDR